MCLNDRQGFRTSIGLSRSRIDDASLRIYFAADFEDRERSNGVHLEIAERILHRVDMADSTSQIKNVRAIVDGSAHGGDVSEVLIEDFDIVANGIDIERVTTAGGVQRIDDRHRCAALN